MFNYWKLLSVTGHPSNSLPEWTRLFTAPEKSFWGGLRCGEAGGWRRGDGGVGRAPVPRKTSGRFTCGLGGSGWATRAGRTSRSLEIASGHFQRLPKQGGGVAASKQSAERREGKASRAKKKKSSYGRSQKCEQPVANNERQLSFSFPPPKGLSYNTESTRHGKRCQVAESRLLCGAGTLAYAAKAFWGFA